MKDHMLGWLVPEKRTYLRIPEWFGKKEKKSILELNSDEALKSTLKKKKKTYSLLKFMGFEYEACVGRVRYETNQTGKKKVASESLKWEGREWKKCPMVIMQQSFKACCAGAKHLQ